MLCAEFPQVQYINVIQMVHVLKAVAIVTGEDLKLSTFVVVSHFLSAKVSPEWRLKPGFGTQKKVSLPPDQRCPFNRGNKYKDYVNIFPGPNFVSPEWRCPLYRGVPNERFHYKREKTVTAQVDQQLFPVQTSHKMYIKDLRSDCCDRSGTCRKQF